MRNARKCYKRRVKQELHFSIIVQKKREEGMIKQERKAEKCVDDIDSILKRCYKKLK